MNLKLLIILVLAVFLVGCGDDSMTGEAMADTVGAENGDSSLAQCLTEKGVKMYGTEWCSHCKNQKAAFGSDFQYIDFIDCDQNRNACQAAGVKGYPTWKIDGKNYPGEQPLERLAALAGC